MGLINTRRTEMEKMIAKELFGKKYSDNLDRNVVYTHEEEMLLMTIKRLLFDGKINDAEDFLFGNINKIKGENYLYIALEFYALLAEKTDEELKELGFSRDEILQGVKDIRGELGID